MLNPNTSLVSVIIPVYNVQSYLVKCIDSVLSQSYRNLEVILVNDGSTDTSLSICREYAKSDERVRIIDKENGGLSSARNYGLDSMKGEYVIFVDSDDYIESDMIDFLMSRIVKSESVDIVTCKFTSFYEGEDVSVSLHDSTNENTVMSPEALRLALYSKETSLHACFKIYKSSLFKDVRFPLGRLYEDAGTIYKVINSARRVTVTDARKYNYLQRKSSITRSNFNPQKLDLLDFSEDIIRFINTHHPEIRSAADYYCFGNAVWLAESIEEAGRLEYHDEYDRCIRLMKGCAAGTMFDKNSSTLNRIYALAFLTNRHLLPYTFAIKRYIKNKTRRALNHA